MKSSKIKIFLAEDDRIDQESFRRMIQDSQLPYDFSIAASVRESREVLSSQVFDVAILDYQLGDGTGFELFDLLKETPIIVITGEGGEEIVARALRAGAYDYLIKDPGLHYLKILPMNVEKAIQKKKTQDQIRMLSHAMRNISDNVFIFDLQGKIIFVNEAFCKTYEYRERDVVGKSVNILSYCAERQDLVLSRLLKSWEGELFHRRSDGSEFPVSISLSFIKDENGKRIAIAGISRDMTERMVAEEKILRYSGELEAKNRELSDFAYTVGHDLKAPLSVFSGFMWVLKNRELVEEESLHIVDEIMNSSFEMADFISTIYELSTAGRIIGEYHPVDLNELIGKVIKRTNPEWKKPGLIFKKELPVIHADPARIKHVFQNILTVASAHQNSPSPGMTITADWEETKEEYRLEFAIQGAGMDSTTLKNHLDFENLKKNIGHRETTAFHLYIASKLIEAHGGKMWVEPMVNDGEGAVFCFTIRKIGEVG